MALPLLLLALGLLAVPAPSAAETFAVDSPADAIDANPGDGVCASPTGACTLRAAVIEANSLSGTDRVELPPGTYLLTLLGEDEDASATGDLDILDDLVIVGLAPTADLVRIDGQGPGALNDRIFHVLPGVEVVVDTLTIAGGSTFYVDGGGLLNSGGDVTIRNSLLTGNEIEGAFGGDGVAIANHGTTNVSKTRIQSNFGRCGAGAGALYNTGTASVQDSTLDFNTGENGGVIINEGTLTISGSTISRGISDSFAGGIANSGILEISDSRLTENRAVFGSGALSNTSSGTVAIRDSEISGNHSDTVAGGLDGPVVMERTSIVDNRGPVGGAIITGLLVNVTISGNEGTAPTDGSDVGGLVAGAPTVIVNSTIANNSLSGGQLPNSIAGFRGGPGVVLKGTVIAGNTGSVPADCMDLSGTMVSDGYNFIGEGDECPSISTASDFAGGSSNPLTPGLLPLQPNGGTGPTHKPLATGPLADAIPVADCTYDHDRDSGTAEIALATDQRGVSRPYGSACDIGSVESAPACDDGIDNDGDSFNDLADPGCRDSSDDVERPGCQDGLDNDGDGGIDFDGGASVNNGLPIAQPDPQCDLAWKTREGGRRCGLGWELVWVIGPMLALSRRLRQPTG